jgi:hypothetical protein
MFAAAGELFLALPAVELGQRAATFWQESTRPGLAPSLLAWPAPHNCRRGSPGAPHPLHQN